jgi:hypothetical protein
MKNFPFGLKESFHGRIELIFSRLLGGTDNVSRKPY